MPLNKFVFQPAISRRVLPAVFCCLAFDCRILLSNTLMLAQIISERQMSDRLFTSCSKCMYVMRAIAVSLDVVTSASNAVLATRRISHVTHPVIQAIQRRQTFNLQQGINRWFGRQRRPADELPLTCRPVCALPFPAPVMMTGHDFLWRLPAGIGQKSSAFLIALREI